VDQLIQDLLANLIQSLPTALAAIGILVGGWLVAWIASAIVRAKRLRCFPLGLRKTTTYRSPRL